VINQAARERRLRPAMARLAMAQPPSRQSAFVALPREL
jgi:hypothetical protein